MIGATASRGMIGLGTTILAAVVTIAGGASARGATGDDLIATSTTGVGADTVTTSTVWELPDSARGGDTVRLALPDHASSSLGDGRWIAASGAVIGIAVLGPDGDLSITLTDAADDPANRRGETIVTTTASTTPGTPESFTSSATSRLRADDVPGAFHGVVDRDAANKYGLWTSTEPAVVRWSIDTPRGPWDTVEVVDTVTPGQDIDCAAGVSVRSTTRMEPDTGYLVDLTDVAADRGEVSCVSGSLRVAVTAVQDGEIVEVAFDATVAGGPRDVENTAVVTATRATAPTVVRATTLQAITAPPLTPEVPAEPGPRPGERLAATGGSIAGAAAGIAVAVALGAAGALALRSARRRDRRSTS